MTKCQICRKEYSPACDYNQGRCPHHPPTVDIPVWRQLVYFIIAPFIIVIWSIMNPKKVWEQAKKDWNING